MANGLSDILSAYREGLRSERETRLGEMQLALNMLESERGREFQREQLRRDDAYKGLSIAKESLNESIAQSANVVYSKALPLFLDDDGVTIKPLSKRQAKKKGIKYEDATDLYNMVSAYRTEGLQTIGQQSAIRIGRKIAADYQYEMETGDRTAYTSDLIKAGVLSDSDNIVDYQLSYQPFLDITKATDALANVDVELSELATGDYDIQRDIAFEKQQVGYGTGGGELDISGLADAFERAGEKEVLDNEELGLGTELSDETILESLTFLDEPEVAVVQQSLSSLSKEIDTKKALLSRKIEERNKAVSKVHANRESLKKLGDKIKYYEKIDNNEKVKSLLKEYRETDLFIKTSDEAIEERAMKSASINPYLVLHGGEREKGTITHDILDLSNDIYRLRDEREKFGG